MFNQEICFQMFLFCTKLHKVTLVKNGWPLKVNGEDHKKQKLYFEMLLFSEKGHKVTLIISLAEGHLNRCHGPAVVPWLATRCLCVFVSCLSTWLVVCCWCHVLSSLLSDPALLVISLLFQLRHLCLPRYPPNWSPHLLSWCLQSCAVSLLKYQMCYVVCVMPGCKVFFQNQVLLVFSCRDSEDGNIYVATGTY